MIKASSLYIVVVISVIIAILTTSFITVAFFYRQEYLKNQRYSRLLSNLESADAILLSTDHKEFNSDEIIDLYGRQTDSIIVRKESWGLYDLAIGKAFTLDDTLRNAFLIGKDTSKDPAAIYLSDEDRPLSVSGDSRIVGDAILPESGIRQSYVDGRTYTGKKLVDGAVKVSKRTLPAVSDEIIQRINELFDIDKQPGTNTLAESVKRSFFNSPLMLDLSDNSVDLTGISLQGKIILVSDTTVFIKKTTSLKDIIICAPVIYIEEGFQGNAQFFARDSIIAEKKTIFDYPSVMAVLKPEDSKIQAKIELGEGSSFSGILFAHEKSRSDLQTIISLGKDSAVKGEIFASGFIKLDKPASIYGKVSGHRFIIKASSVLYENYLIDILINRPARNKYYLSSGLFNDYKINRVMEKLD